MPSSHRKSSHWEWFYGMCLKGLCLCLQPSDNVTPPAPERRMCTHDFQLDPSLRGALKTAIMKADFQGSKSPEPWNPQKTSQAYQNLAFTKAQATEKRKGIHCHLSWQKNLPLCRFQVVRLVNKTVIHICLQCIPSCTPALCQQPVGRKSCLHVPVYRNVAAVASGITADYLWAVPELLFQSGYKINFIKIHMHNGAVCVKDVFPHPYTLRPDVESAFRPTLHPRLPETAAVAKVAEIDGARKGFIFQYHRPF